MRQDYDFIATLKYRTAEEGGRKTPVFKTGYRPQIKFEFAEMQTSGQQTFLDKDVIYPGDTATAKIQLISPQFFEGQLTAGMSFDFREGSRIIGTGHIIEILNESLRKPAADIL